MLEPQSNSKTETTFNIEFVELDHLKAHEEVDWLHLRELKDEIKSDGVLKYAIAVDKDSNLILDGHHRVAALKELGYKKIPVVFVNYSSPIIRVESQRNGINLTKEEVMKAGLSQKKFPPKTSRHLIRVDGVWKHILAIQKQVNIPLEKLKSDAYDCG